MENKQFPSKNKLIAINEEKLIREVDYLAASQVRQSRKPLPIDLEILHKNPGSQQGSQKVLVSIKPRAPAIKTLYIAEKSRYSRKESSKSGARLAIGDHSSFTTHFSENENDANTVNSIACGADNPDNIVEAQHISSVVIQVDSSTCASKCSSKKAPRGNVYNDKPRSPEKCYIYTQPNMNLPKLEAKVNASTINPQKVDIATLIITNTSSENSSRPINSTISKLHKRIDHLERKILRQEMVFRAFDSDATLSSSDDDTKNPMRTNSKSGRPGCSYIQQYSHVPETSAFQRYAHQAAPLSPSKATTIEKEHNSEQYGRDFTTYDGITARGRRQCASVPCKRDDIPKLAAERMHKIRHKLNPVRDYRLMDTVHYLAQGEFAPRDDGIKLTPSREAVLSDIIYEDVCRTHWPNTRLGRRAAHAERCGTRGELQRLIDSLLRERVAHVERRRRRHYRIVKLNHRHESCRPLGKTGDIIVASHKNKPGSEDAAGSDLNPGSGMMIDRRRKASPRRSHRSHERLIEPELRQKHRYVQDKCSPGTSYANRSPSVREPTCCYQASTKPKPSNCDRQPILRKNQCEGSQDLTSGSSVSNYTSKPKNPKVVVKKDANRRKHTRDEPNLEHYILLPTLVVRTPSNMKRQKKFNELYHKILNVQLNSQNAIAEVAERGRVQGPNKKDIGFNINITLSNSTEDLNEG